MSIHIPWAEQAQLTEFSTETNFIGPLRECVRIYTELSAEARRNVLLMADVDVPLPGRSPTKILEQPELETLLGLVDFEPISTAVMADIIQDRLERGLPIRGA